MRSIFSAALCLVPLLVAARPVERMLEGSGDVEVIEYRMSTNSWWRGNLG